MPHISPATAPLYSGHEYTHKHNEWQNEWAASRVHLQGAPKLIQVVTDDSQISEEISTISKEGFEFLKPDPAPKRIPDKVYNNVILNLLNNFSAR